MIGIHVHKEKRKTLQEAITEDIEKYNLKNGALQIYVMSSMSSKIINLGNKEDIIDDINKNKCKLFVHASHVTNGMWNADTEKQKRGIYILYTQLKIAQQINAAGFVIHLPKKSPAEIKITLEKISAKLNSEFSNIKILLEHPTYKPDPISSYEMPAKLNNLTEVINGILVNWGYCIDTAHMWSAISVEDRSRGYDVENYGGMKKWIADLNKTTKTKISLIHLNGSMNEHSSNKDKHGIPFYDRMWSDYRKSLKKSGLYRLLRLAVARKIPMIIERNYGSDDELFDSLKLIKKNITKLKKKK